VVIHHHKGDACDESVLAELFGKGTVYSTAIVLGSGPSVSLPAAICDSRVLQMMLILRKLTEDGEQTMHVIGENSVDQTSQLALGPHVTSLSDADFVNTQAIIARTLVLNLAYPQIWDALSEMLSPRPNSPEIEIVSCSTLGIIGNEVSIGAVQHMLSKLYFGCAVAIGYMSGVEMTLAPSSGSKVLWTKDHRLITIVRKFRFNTTPEPSPTTAGSFFLKERF